MTWTNQSKFSYRSTGEHPTEDSERPSDAGADPEDRD